MRTLLPALFALGIGFTGIVGASAMVGPGTINTATTNFSPRVQQVTRECRLVTQCDQNGKNCHTVNKCTY